MSELGDVRWMTYAEMSQLFGIERASAKRLVARKRWARTRGNDGLARIGVPADQLDRAVATDLAADDLAEPANDDSDADAPLREQLARAEGEIAGLREALRIAEAELAEGRARLARVEGQRDEALRDAARHAPAAGEVQGLKSSLAFLRQVLEHTRAAADAAEARAEARVGEAVARAEAAARQAAEQEGRALDAERRLQRADDAVTSAEARGEEARRRATEAEARAAMADRATLDARQALARLRERRLVARLLNRGP